MEFVRKLGDVEAVIVDRDGQIFYSAGLEPPRQGSSAQAGR